MGREELEAKLAVVVVEGRVELVRPMDPAPIDHHHDLFLGFPEGGHHLMEILAQLLGIKMRHNLIEHFGGPVLNRANDAEQHATGDTAPRTILQPRLAFETLVALALALAQRPWGEACALGCAPPACPREGKTPEDSLIFIEQDDLATACLVCEGGECE